MTYKWALLIIFCVMFALGVTYVSLRAFNGILLEIAKTKMYLAMHDAIGEIEPDEK